ncbi:DUF294 nucleotidyltransferase-like domain-containing protein [Litchfieldia salsa]|uniref:CBS domain-containing protein n=1 Tax=Litchfieldia salsa TaxID=930152 RepID=A0A1H0TBP3_9BACI|nr:DUF294 nucleotidyltransferase-like domain-containing protein [Litchfieldia salsa]SDP51462.1 CBS domain-containing protein [Litchfieldia salsa]
MQQYDLQILLKDYYPFDLLSENQLNEVVTNARRVQFKKGEFLFREEESIEELDLYFLVSGLSKNILHQSNGKQVSLRYYYPGDIVGLMVMFTSGELNFSVQALEDCSVFKLSKAHFFEIMLVNPTFSKVIWESIGERMKTLYNEIKSNTASDEDENIRLLSTRVKTFMDTPYFISPNEPMTQAARLMKEHQLSGLIVRDVGQKTLGTLSYIDILRFISEGNLNDLVENWYNKRFFKVNDDTFTYEALAYFKYDYIQIIPVYNQNRIIGMVTPRSFLNLNNSNFLELSYRVLTTKKIEELKELGTNRDAMFQSFINELLDNESLAYDVTEVISNHNDTIHRQLIKLTELEMKDEGYGNPPVNYCFITMGSQARSEQGFSTDQDNGLIIDNFDHLENSQFIHHYFQTFATKLNAYLNEVGFPECTGKIMAKELKWRKSLNQWKNEIASWKKELDAEEIQSFTMFYDFRPIFGDFSIAEEIRTFLTEKVKGSNLLQYMLVKDSLKWKIPVSPLGLMNLNQKNKKIDIKKIGLIQIINTVRIYAIKYGIEEVNTIKRLHRLKEIKAMHPRDVENAKTALHYLQHYRLKQNILQLSNGFPVSNEIKIQDLSKEDKWKLKEAIQIANRMQQATKITLNRTRGV